ncbi:MAG: hypothetical protein LUG86_02760 [Oscillospiraceae bacterium]|nr:hypothetical protein [Oscillospiraceae bacterium]
MKKILSIMLSLLLVMSILPLGIFADEEGGESNTTTSNTPTITTSYGVTIQNPTVSTQTINAGDTFTIGFTLSSNSTVNYEYTYGSYNYATWDSTAQTTASISGSGFSFSGYLAEQELHSGYNTVTVLSDSSLETGRYQLTLTVTCTSTSGSVVSDSRTFNIDVESSEVTLDEENDAPSFTMTGASIPEGKGKSNLSTKLTLSFENDTGYTANNVKVVLSNLGGLVLNTYTDTVDCGTVVGGESITATFPVVFPEYPTAQHTLQATVNYTDNSGNEHTETFNIYLRATEKTDSTETTTEKSLEPKVIVSGYTLDVDTVESGEEFTLTFTLRNTSHDKAIKNMTVDVETASSSNSTTSTNIFSAIDGTTSFYTEEIPTDGEMEYSIALKTSATAGAGTYPITIRYDFEYDNGSSYSASSNSITINLQVSQAIKFELMEWEPPTECYGSQGCSIYFQFFNKSKTAMSSLTIGVSGDFYMATEYYGTLSASSYDYFSGMIYPNDPDAVGETKTAILTFSFEDESGAEHTLEYEFDVLICEEQETTYFDDSSYMDDDYYFDDEFSVDASGDNISDGTGLGLPVKIAIGVGAGVIAIVIIVVAVAVINHKKKKALLDGLDDDDDDDDE